MPRLRTPTGDSSSDAACLNILLSSLSQCVREHEACHEISNSPWVPTRLIDVGYTSGFENVRLVRRQDVLAENPGAHINYTTLSHVWGKEAFLTLATANEQAMQSSFQLSALPQSFKDAIALTRHIGLRYI